MKPLVWCLSMACLLLVVALLVVAPARATDYSNIIQQQQLGYGPVQQFADPYAAQQLVNPYAQLNAAGSYGMVQQFRLERSLQFARPQQLQQRIVVRQFNSAPVARIERSVQVQRQRGGLLGGGLFGGLGRLFGGGATVSRERIVQRF